MKTYVDIGDYVGVEGEIYTTQTGDFATFGCHFRLFFITSRQLYKIPKRQL